jgi:hypothetical protein
MVTGVLPLTKFMSGIADHPAAVYQIKINFLMLNTAVADPIRVTSTSFFQWIRDILLRILLFLSLIFKMPTTTSFQDFMLGYFLKVHLHNSSMIKT